MPNPFPGGRGKPRSNLVNKKNNRSKSTGQMDIFTEMERLRRNAARRSQMASKGASGNRDQPKKVSDLLFAFDRLHSLELQTSDHALAESDPREFRELEEELEAFRPKIDSIRPLLQKSFQRLADMRQKEFQKLSFIRKSDRLRSVRNRLKKLGKRYLPYDQYRERQQLQRELYDLQKELGGKLSRVPLSNLLAKSRSEVEAFRMAQNGHTLGIHFAAFEKELARQYPRDPVLRDLWCYAFVLAVPKWSSTRL